MSFHRWAKQVGRAGAAMACAVCACGLSSSPARALDINLSFNSGASAAPSFDPTGAQLSAVFDAAASFWEDYIHDTHTVDVEFYYTDLSDTFGTLATHENLGTSGGKPTASRIRIDTELDGVEQLWFFDPTPFDHGEYDLQQTLYRDLSGLQQTQWFNGAPPSLLEVGYRGHTVLGAPADAVNGFDILSTLIHELGHAVGLTVNVASGEYADGDYDVPPGFVGGATMGIVGDFHLDAHTSLMCGGCGATGLRRLPTATDVLAVATAAGWAEIDLPRQEFLSGTDWQTPANWVGGALPDGDDVASIRTRTVDLVDTQTVAEALVSEEAKLRLGPTGQLNAGGGVRLESGGQVTGVGAIAGPVTNDSGGVAPGLSIGTLSINGDYAQAADGWLRVEIDGQLDDADLLEVQGAVSLDGWLHIEDTGSAAPQLGDAFDVLTADSISGGFGQARVTGTDLGAGAALAVLYLDTDADTLADTVRLLATYRGDADGDGAVSLADLDALGTGFGAAGATWRRGDFDYDGAVTLADLDALGANFGAATANAANSAVPEPASVVGLGLGGLALARRRRR